MIKLKKERQKGGIAHLSSNEGKNVLSHTFAHKCTYEEWYKDDEPKQLLMYKNNCTLVSYYFGISLRVEEVEC